MIEAIAIQCTSLFCRCPEFHFGSLDLHNRIPEMGIPNCETEKGNFIHCLGEQPQGALSTSTYGEVSSIFLGQNIAKSDIFGFK